jgi:hypothetical protein
MEFERRVQIKAPRAKVEEILGRDLASALGHLPEVARGLVISRVVHDDGTVEQETSWAFEFDQLKPGDRRAFPEELWRWTDRIVFKPAEKLAEWTLVRFEGGPLVGKAVIRLGDVADETAFVLAGRIGIGPGVLNPEPLDLKVRLEKVAIPTLASVIARIGEALEASATAAPES